MKKKRFYNDKRRNEKWTEQPVGRKIYFADKYDTDDKPVYNKKQQKVKKPVFTQEKLEKFLKGLIITVCSVVIVGIGYTIMDIHMDRHAMPLENTDGSDTANLNNITIFAKGAACQPLSLDGSIMLNTVINNAFDNGYSALAFDLKRDDGTIGYESQLATILSYGAVSSPSKDLQGSVNMMKENDILPIGRISCYKDNIAPAADLSYALYKDGGLYKDNAGNTYLSPDSETAVSYIKSIIDEAMGLGITMFILDNYDLPDDISNDFDDGFDSLAEQLYSDFGDELKLFRAVDINITSNSAKAIEEEWKEKTEDIDTNDNTVMLCISSSDPSITKQFLDNNGITNYIIFE